MLFSPEMQANSWAVDSLIFTGNPGTIPLLT
jgi:hypothetical protein